MPEEQDDTVPNEEQDQETTPDGDSSPSEQTADPLEQGDAEEESSQEETDDTDETTADDADDGSEDGEEKDRKETEAMIPLSRHKAILEKARRGEESNSGADTQSTDGDEEEVELTPAARAALRKEVRAEMQEEERSKTFNREVARLGKTYNGKDGLPKFDLDKAVEHGKKVGIYNLEKAYRDLNAKALEDSLRKKIAAEAAQNPPDSSDRPGASTAAREQKGQRKERVDMGDRSAIAGRIREVRQRLESKRR